MKVWFYIAILFLPSLSQAGERAWHRQLSLSQWSTLQAISGHPAMGACLRAANEGHPVAIYHLRNLATYADAVTQGNHPAQDYVWPANGFRWCLKQAGMPLHSGQTSLEALRQRYVNLVRRHYGAARMVDNKR